MQHLSWHTNTITTLQGSVNGRCHVAAQGGHAVSGTVSGNYALSIDGLFGLFTAGSIPAMPNRFDATPMAAMDDLGSNLGTSNRRLGTSKPAGQQPVYRVNSEYLNDEREAQVTKSITSGWFHAPHRRLTPR